MNTHVKNLRDAALAAMRKPGIASWQRVGGARLLVGECGLLRIAFRTPFQVAADMPARRTYERALVVQESGMLSYGLDIWSGRKVLSVQWEDDGTFKMISYSPGKWERQLETVAF